MSPPRRETSARAAAADGAPPGDAPPAGAPARPRRRPHPRTRQGRHGRHAAHAHPEPPRDTIGRRAAGVLEAQRTEMHANLGSALDGRDPEGVHDMRVASRRLRAALQVFAPWLGARERARIEPAMRRVTRALGRVRELDVLRLRLAELARRARPERALAIEAVDARLANRRRRARARMMAEFAKVDLDRLDHRLRRCAAHLAARGTPAETEPTAVAVAASGAAAVAADGRDQAQGDASADPAAGGAAAQPAPRAAGEAPTAPGQSAEAPVADLLWIAAPEVVSAARAALDHPVPPEVGTPEAATALHEIRIAAKKLRYLLEILAPPLGDPASGLVKQLKRLQDRLGDFHDDTVLDETLRDAIERAAERERPRLAGELRRFRALRRRSLARDEQGVRAALQALRADHLAGQIERALVAAGVPADRLAGVVASGDGASDAAADVVESSRPPEAAPRAIRRSRGGGRVRAAGRTETSR